LQEENDIIRLLTTPTIFEIASDGGFDPISGILSYGWVLSMNRVLTAKGRGPGEAHPTLAESFHSEGYGLESASRFIVELIDYFNIVPNEHTWKFYIDYKAMIDRMESYNLAIRHSQWNLRSDADITNQANKNLHKIPATFIHVKSHQDSGKDIDKLTFNAQLNILADALATQQREEMPRPISKATTNFCHLVINNKYITRDTKKQIIQEAGKIPIQNHYHGKYGWSASTFESIHWELQLKALRYFKWGDQRRLLKFAHGWLPTNARLFREAQESSPACRCCGSLEETNDHILVCSHKALSAHRKKWMEYLKRDTENHGNPEMNKLIETALCKSAADTTWKPTKDNHHSDLHQCIKQQNKIGWHHLFKGRMAKEWTRFMETHYRKINADSKKYSGERWGKLLLINIWSTTLELWATRNEVIHGTQQLQEQSTEKQRLESRVRKIFENAHMLENQDRHKIFYNSIDEMLLEDSRYLKAWIKMAQRVMAAAKKEAKVPRNAQKLMESYFSWKQSKAAKTTANDEPRSSAVQHPD
jgi:hypothetical protein